MQQMSSAVAPPPGGREEPILKVTDVTKHYRLKPGWMPWQKGPVLQAVDGHAEVLAEHPPGLGDRP